MNGSPPPYLLPAIEALRRGDVAAARLLAEQALVEHADDPPVLHLLGVVCCRAGDLEVGAAHLAAAFDKQPDNLEIRLVLARALLDQGRMPDCGNVARLGLHPELSGIAVEAARRLGNSDAEAAALGDLVRFQPRNGPLRRAHGHALAAIGQRDAAAEALDYAIQFEPQSIETRIELAQILTDSNEQETALRVYEDAEALAPDRADLILGRARLLVKLRRFDAAEEAYRRALAIAPGLVDLTREYGLLLERTGRPNCIPVQIERAIAAGASRHDFSLLEAMLAFRRKDYAEALSLAARSPDDDPVRRLRLIAKIHEARGDGEAAFDAAAAMNLAVPDRDGWRRKGAAARAEIRRLARVTTPQWPASFPPPPRGVHRSPAFIVGFPRSGTTLLDTFLMGHPDAAVLEEEPLLEAAKAVVGDLALLPSVSMATIDRARDAYFDAVADRVDPAFTGLVIDKMPFNMLGAGLITRLFPDARIIFAQRHPCDVVLSGFMQSFRLNDGMASFLDLDDAADLYDAAMSLWTASREHLPLHVHDLVYERLVDDPASELRAVVAFLGLPWHEDLLDHVATAKSRGTIITPSYDQVVQPINNKAVDRWRGVRPRLQSVLPILMPWARKLGYSD